MSDDPNAPIVMGTVIGEEACTECDGRGRTSEDDGEGHRTISLCDFCEGTGRLVWRRAVVERRCGHREAVNVVSERHAQEQLNHVCADCRAAAIRALKEKEMKENG